MTNDMLEYQLSSFFFSLIFVFVELNILYLVSLSTITSILSKLLLKGNLGIKSILMISNGSVVIGMRIGNPKEHDIWALPFDKYHKK